MVSQTGSSTNTSNQTTTFAITNSFIWRGSALQGTISNAQSGGTTTSTFTYNTNTYLTYASTTGATAKQISYTILRQAQDNRAVGQVMVRAQTTGGSTTSPKDYSFFFNGNGG